MAGATPTVTVASVIRAPSTPHAITSSTRRSRSSAACSRLGRADVHDGVERAFTTAWSAQTAAANVSPYRCAKSWQELGKLTPHVAAGRGQEEARIAALKELVAFRNAHAAAKARWMNGDREVVFPPGTYWMRVHHGAHTAAFGDT